MDEGPGSGISVDDYYGDEEVQKTVSQILDVIFNLIIVFTMCLCLFALSASMSANIVEQTKEIGIMRAMGFTRYRLYWLYFYESFILVFSSCFMGIIIGTIIGWTMLI